MSVAYVRPGSLEEALAARARHPEWMVLAGGTDLLVGARDRPPPPGIIDVFGLPTLTGIRRDADGTTVIGAATPFAEILADADIAARLPLLTAAVREIGAAQIQTRGTLGGNVVTSSPVGDTLPVLLVLDAAVDLAGPGRRRTLPYEAFCTGYRATALAADELVLAVRIPAPPPGLRQYWRKVGTRRAQSIAKVAVAAAAVLDGGRLERVRIGLGAVAARPIRARATEAALEGAIPGPELAAAARRALVSEIAPIDDLRSTAAYRRAVAGNLAARCVLWLAEEARSSTGTEPRR
jgi:CO/xanthine dehydrogenase FAD-binding subunit